MMCCLRQSRPQGRILTNPRLLPAGILLCCLAGCSKGADGLALVPVSGTVTLNGEPLSGALVTFIPTGDTRGSDVSGRTDRRGSYRLVTPKGQEGAAVGTYKVTISRLLLRDGSEYVPDLAVPPIESPARESLPAHYSDGEQTTLKAEVLAKGGTIPFALRTKK